MGIIRSGPRQELYEYVWASSMFKDWHWLAWNFDRPRSSRSEAYAAARIVDALLCCEAKMPGFSHEMVDRVAALGGRVKEQDDYESIRQWLAELLVVNHFVSWSWPTGTSFEHEPSCTKGGSNPEMIVRCQDTRIGIEVKCPDLRKHRADRFSNDTQHLARMNPSVSPALGTGKTTFPRDNPIKDFLAACETKFGQFREDPGFRSLLFVVWDDYVNEPISALLSPVSGLLTENSFARDSDGERISFSSTDGIVILRHQHQFVEGLANRPALDDRHHFLDYGMVGHFPHNTLIINEEGKGLPSDVADATQAVPPSARLGAEYVPSELVMWFG